jgi:hypothetical protein
MLRFILILKLISIFSISSSQNCDDICNLILANEPECQKSCILISCKLISFSDLKDYSYTATCRNRIIHINEYITKNISQVSCQNLCEYSKREYSTCGNNSECSLDYCSNENPISFRIKCQKQFEYIHVGRLHLIQQSNKNKNEISESLNSNINHYVDSKILNENYSTEIVYLSKTHWLDQSNEKNIFIKSLIFSNISNATDSPQSNTINLTELKNITNIIEPTLKNNIRYQNMVTCDNICNYALANEPQCNNTCVKQSCKKKKFSDSTRFVYTVKCNNGSLVLSSFTKKLENESLYDCSNICYYAQARHQCIFCQKVKCSYMNDNILNFEVRCFGINYKGRYLINLDQGHMEKLFKNKFLYEKNSTVVLIHHSQKSNFSYGFSDNIIKCSDVCIIAKEMYSCGSCDLINCTTGFKLIEFTIKCSGIYRSGNFSSLSINNYDIVLDNSSNFKSVHVFLQISCYCVNFLITFLFYYTNISE